MSIKNLSLFVPHIFTNFDKEYIAYSFSEIGDIERVDLVAKMDKNGKNYNAAYIHFKRWFPGAYNADLQERLLRNGSVKWYYDENDEDGEYYWIVLPNTAKKYMPGERKQRINLNELIKKDEPIDQEEQDHLDKIANTVYYDKDTTNPIQDENPIQDDVDDNIIIDFVSQMIEEEDDEDKNLIAIDWRYVQELEQENAALHAELHQLRSYLSYYYM